MPNIEAVKAGIAGCYLSKVQMTALLRAADAAGLAKQQILKAAVVGWLVEEGLLDERELVKVEMKQQELRANPHSSRKEVQDLRLARKMTPEDEKKEAERRAMAESFERLRDISTGKVSAVADPEPVRQRRRRKRRPISQSQ